MRVRLRLVHRCRICILVNVMFYQLVRTPSHSSAGSGKQAKPAACHSAAGLAFSSAAVNMAAVCV
jgi:hypothetical protein